MKILNRIALLISVVSMVVSACAAYVSYSALKEPKSFSMQLPPPPRYPIVP